MKKELTTKQIATRNLEETDIYLLISFSKEGVKIDSHMKDKVFAFLGAMEYEQQKIIKLLEDQTRKDIGATR